MLVDGGAVVVARVWPYLLSASVETATTFNKVAPDLLSTRSSVDLGALVFAAWIHVLDSGWRLGLLGSGSEAAAAPKPEYLVPFSPLLPWWRSLRLCQGGRGDLYRSFQQVLRDFMTASSAVRGGWLPRSRVCGKMVADLMSPPDKVRGDGRI